MNLQMPQDQNDPPPLLFHHPKHLIACLMCGAWYAQRKDQPRQTVLLDALDTCHPPGHKAYVPDRHAAARMVTYGDLGPCIPMRFNAATAAKTAVTDT